MTHTILDIVVYTIAAAWTIGYIVVSNLGRIKQTKLYRFFENCYYWILKKFFHKKLIAANLKRLSKVPKQKGEQRFTVKGTPIYAKSQLDAMKKYADVLKMRVVYKEVKL